MWLWNTVFVCSSTSEPSERRPRLTDASILIKPHYYWSPRRRPAAPSAGKTTKMTVKKRAYLAKPSDRIVPVTSSFTAAQKHFANQSDFPTRVENKILAMVSSLIECTVLFVAVLQSLFAVATPRLSGAFYYAFVLLPLSLVLASSVGVAAAEETIDD